MPLGTVQPGQGLTLSISATQGGIYSPLSDINNFRYNATRNSTTVTVFGRTVGYTNFSPEAVTATASGFLSVGDTGQDLARTTAQTNATAFIKVLHDGVNGFTQEVRVGTRTREATTDGLQATTFEFGAVGVPVVVGTGPLP